MTAVCLGLLSGLVFGYIITRVGATNPDRMARAHLMEDPDIPQFMLTAVLVSAVGLTGLVAVDRADLSVLPTSLLATGLAAVLFGIGWGLTGYCPGTAWAAAGEGRMDALFALAGGLAGTAAFAHLHGAILPVLYGPTNVGKLTLMDALGGSRNAATLLLAAGLAVAVGAIGKLWGRPRDA
ncbi:MAG: DUF6691 family protein [Planctomycetota bacterium]